MKLKEDSNPHPESTTPSAWDSAQEWMKEHKVITALAAAAVLYLVGGRRLRQLASLAAKSGVAAGMANAAIGTIIPQSKSAPTEENIYH